MKNVFKTASLGVVALGTVACTSAPTTSFEDVVTNQAQKATNAPNIIVPYVQTLSCYRTIEDFKINQKNAELQKQGRPLIPERVVTVGRVGEDTNKNSLTEGGFIPAEKALEEMLTHTLVRADFKTVDRNVEFAGFVARENQLFGQNVAAQGKVVKPTERFTASMTGLDFNTITGGFEFSYDGVGFENTYQTGLINAIVKYTEVDTTLLISSGRAHGTFDGNVFELQGSDINSDNKFVFAVAGVKKNAAMSIITHAVLNKAAANAYGATVPEYQDVCESFSAGDVKFSISEMNKRLREQAANEKDNTTSSVSFNDSATGVSSNDNDQQFSSQYPEAGTWEKPGKMSGASTYSLTMS